VRTAMQEDGFGPESSFDVVSRYHVPNYRFSNHTTKFHVPVGTRRGIGQAAHEFYRESFMNELAHAAGMDPYRYRRELIARTSLPYKDDMIRALDIAAEMSDWGKPLPRGTARAIALEERGGETSRMATISAMVHTVSVSPQGKVRLERVDVAHDTGFSLINPLSVKKQLEGQITWFYNDAMHQANTIKTDTSSKIISTRSGFRTSTNIRPRSTCASSRPDTGCSGWATTAPLQSSPRSATRFSRSPESASGIFLTAVTI